jgi:phosphonate degradation associated HDIG domain protein
MRREYNDRRLCFKRLKRGRVGFHRGMPDCFMDVMRHVIFYGGLMTALNTLFELYAAHGAQDYIGEPVTQLAHMQQAAWLARSAGAHEDLILAAFFHDLGHLCADVEAPQMDGLGVVGHEQIGADYLTQCGFSERVTAGVASHVAAKRYLCCRKPGYYDKLSEASKGTLNFQGGPMSEEEALYFEGRAHFKDFLRLRAWDEAAKKVDGAIIELEEMKAMAQRHLVQQQSNTGASS